jgi:murein DD-endopeptidase MepM/ murein hydrolase activator NlpD
VKQTERRPEGRAERMAGMNFGRRGTFFAFAISVCLLTIGFSSYHRINIPSLFKSEQPPEAPPEMEVAEQEPEAEIFEYSIPRNSTIQDILMEANFTRQEAHRLIEEVRPVYNLGRIHAGNRISVERTFDGTLKSLRYEINDEEYLVVDQEEERYVASRHKHEFDVVVDEFYGEIKSSLWNALVSRGEEPRLINEMIDILQWDVDFTSIQSGDSFKVIVEKSYLGDRFVKYGRIQALQFVTGGKTFTAVWFEHPATGKGAYYDHEGKAVRKALLRVPFRFSPRISSRFSHSRLHPILNQRRPHLGVDYAAPAGTPVLASGSGRVIFAGWQGGYGNLIKIRHASGYVTHYAHLSRMLVRQGANVSQSQVIGHVGATGLATGPHLDYRIQDPKGRFINPTRFVDSAPPEKIDQRYWSDFAAVRDTFLLHLAAILEEEPEPDNFAIAG